MCSLDDLQVSLGILQDINSKFKASFESLNAPAELCKILEDMLQDSSVKAATLIVDALDECIDGRDMLLEFIVSQSSSGCNGSYQAVMGMEVTLQAHPSRTTL